MISLKKFAKERKKELEEYIRRHQVYTNEYTHTWVGNGKYRGKYKFDEEFTELYIKESNLSFSERQCDIGPLLIDIDYKFKESERKYNVKDIEYVTRAITSTIRSFIIIDKIRLYVTEKEKPTIIKDGSKDGFHVMCMIPLSKIQRYVIYDRLKDELDFSNLSPINNDILDRSTIITNNWMVYGSKKETGQVYKLTHVYEDNKEIFPRYTYGELVEILSIRQFRDDEPIRDSIPEDIIKTVEDKYMKHKHIHITIPETTQPVDIVDGYVYNKEYMNKLLDLLKPEQICSHMNWVRIMCFCKRYGLREKAHELSRRTDKYNSREVEYILNTRKPNYVNIGVIHKLAREADKDKYMVFIKENKVQLSIVRSDEIYKNSDVKPTIEESSRYNTYEMIRDINKKGIIVESYCGTGKTTMINKYLKDNRESTYLFIDSNRSLSVTHSKVIEGCDTYLSKDTIDEDHMSISFEQLYKVHNKYDIIIIDEVSTFMEKYFSPTMRKLRLSVIALLRLMKDSKKIIMLDSTITDSVIHQMTAIVGNDYEYYRNYYKPSEGKDIKIYRYEDNKRRQIDILNTFIEKFKGNVMNSEQMIIFSDSKEKCNQIYELLKPVSDRLKLITADNCEIKDLYDCNERFKGKIIITSPKIIYGLDITLKYGEGDVISVMKGSSIGSRLLYQQINRCRNLLDVNVLYLPKKDKINYYMTYEYHVWKETKKFNKYLKNIKEVDKYVTYAKEICTKIDECGDVKLDERNMFTKIYLLETWYKKLLDYDKLQMFIILCREQGFKIIDEKLDNVSKSKIDSTELSKKFQEEIKENNKKYIEEKKDNAVSKEKIDRRLEIVNLSVDEINKDTIEMREIKEIITDDNLFKQCMQSRKLYMNETEMKKYYTAKLDNGKVDEYTLVHQKYYNPLQMLCLKKLEKILGIERNESNKYSIDLNKINKFNRKKLDRMKNLLKDALYGECGEKKKKEMIDKKFKKINNNEGVQCLLKDLYNKIAGGDLIIKGRINHKNNQCMYKINEQLREYHLIFNKYSKYFEEFEIVE